MDLFKESEIGHNSELFFMRAQHILSYQPWKIHMLSIIIYKAD